MREEIRDLRRVDEGLRADVTQLRLEMRPGLG